jgi:hypothetical protein
MWKRDVEEGCGRGMWKRDVEEGRGRGGLTARSDEKKRRRESRPGIRIPLPAAMGPLGERQEG